MKHITDGGNDDFDRYARFCESHLTIYRCDTPLFHLFHPRGKNSQYNTNFQRNKSDSELQKQITTSPATSRCWSTVFPIVQSYKFKSKSQLFVTT